MVQVALIMFLPEEAARRSTNRPAEETLAERGKDPQVSENPIQPLIATYEHEAQDKMAFRPPEHSGPMSDEGGASA